MTDIQDDQRWQRLMDPDYQCECCGTNFSGLIDISFNHPATWPHDARKTQNAVAVGEDRLGANLCSIGEARYVRCSLRLPVQGTDQVFAYGVWAQLGLTDYDAYLAHFDGDTDFDGCFAWLANPIPGWEVESALPCDLIPGPLGQRPSLTVHEESGHPIAPAQDNGIDFETLLDIYAAAGKDIRPHLGEP
ncbi:DUF2199 domain-containing protein [Halovulum sp. GXIMD14793]